MRSWLVGGLWESHIKHFEVLKEAINTGVLAVAGLSVRWDLKQHPGLSLCGLSWGVCQVDAPCFTDKTEVPQRLTTQTEADGCPNPWAKTLCSELVLFAPPCFPFPDQLTRKPYYASL